MSRSRATRVAARLIALGASVLISLLLTELLVRLLAPQPRSWLEIYRRHPELPFYAIQPGVEQLVDTGETRWYVHTDEQGYRDLPREVPPAADGRPTILVLGDSFTFGHGVDYDQTYVHRIERMLGGDYRLVNTSVGGYGPAQYRQILEWELARGAKPRAVLVGVYLGNDLADCIIDKDLEIIDGTLGGRRGVRAFTKRHSHVYRLVSQVYHRLVPGERERDRAHLFSPSQWASGRMGQAADAFRREMAGIAALAAERRIPLLVALLPTRAAVAARRGEVPAVEGADFELPRRRTLAMLAELGIEVVDLAPALAPEPTSETYLRFDGHWTPRGHELAAAPVVRALRELATATGRPEPGARAPSGQAASVGRRTSGGARGTHHPLRIGRLR